AELLYHFGRQFEGALAHTTVPDRFDFRSIQRETGDILQQRRIAESSDLLDFTPDLLEVHVADFLQEERFRNIQARYRKDCHFPRFCLLRKFYDDLSGFK